MHRHRVDDAVSEAFSWIAWPGAGGTNMMIVLNTSPTTTWRRVPSADHPVARELVSEATEPPRVASPS